MGPRMCGICGLVVPGGLSGSDRIALEAMNAMLTHRGPDDGGIHVAGECGLAMRRLSIIDLETGHQPISNEAGDLAIVLNGEIYNYKALRSSMDEGGQHRFTTRSDTEVVLHLFEDRGKDTLHLLKGMFAIAIYDRKRRRLFLARDRFGEKPLFYRLTRGGIAFSSELRSLLEAPGGERRLNHGALQSYLHYGFIPSPQTIYEGICQLPPGHWLEHNGGETLLGSYYDPEPPATIDLMDERTAEEAVRHAILEAVGRQMVSDVPIGAFLSGGIDSSTVVAAMQRHSNRPVKTFTVRFEYAPYDESSIARKVAHHLGTDHYELHISNGAFDETDLWRIVDHVGQPFADSSAIPTYQISKLVREHVKVCLSGDGGDELFAGYPFFRWVLAADYLSSLAPAAALRLAARSLRGLSGLPLFRRLSPLRALWRGVEAAAQPIAQRPLWIYQLFDPGARAELLIEPLREDPMSGGRARGSRLRQLMAFRMGVALPEDMLVKVDRMSMAASLEVRAPMLDPDLVATSMRLPDRHLLRGKTGKYILRSAARPWLPNEVLSHPKTGFSIPMHMFQNDRYAEMCNDLILGGKSGFMAAVFRRPAMEAIVQRGLGQKSDSASRSVYKSSHQLWALLQVAAWADRFCAVP